MICPRCHQQHDRPKGQKYCLGCHAAYQREWRKTHPLSPEARRRDNARSYAREYKKRGLLTPRPCDGCGAADAQMHHIDHERPLDVTWLCRRCHLDWHAFWRGISRLTFDGWLSDRRENSGFAPVAEAAE